MNRGPSQAIETLALGTGRSLPAELVTLGTRPTDEGQLRYCLRYVRKWLGARSAALEHHYIDRDHIEDHSAFYSKSLYPYDNFCRRVHFFTISKDELERVFGLLTLNRVQRRPRVYSRVLRELRTQYCGFLVLRPLPGSPVGRTILRPPIASSSKSRLFQNLPSTTPHLAGNRLQVYGLPFQQQDVGVSACATTALWTALHHASKHEAIQLATPAQITLIAAKNTLPFGRAMPSEGLSVDQMCQAIQGFGLSPNLYRVESDWEEAQATILSVARSGIPQILILRDVRDPSRPRAHAVVVAGVRIGRQPSSGRSDSHPIRALYLHDDRYGPYLYATVAHDTSTLQVRIALHGSLQHDGNRRSETWNVAHILVPTHPKIRLGFPGLRKIGIAFAHDYVSSMDLLRNKGLGSVALDIPPSIATSFIRSSDYPASAVAAAPDPDLESFRLLAERTALPRYVGVIRLSFGDDVVDVLMDSTSTHKNPYVIAICALTRGLPIGLYIASRIIASAHSCPLIAPAITPPADLPLDLDA